MLPRRCYSSSMIARCTDAHLRVTVGARRASNRFASLFLLLCALQLLAALRLILDDPGSAVHSVCAIGHGSCTLLSELAEADAPSPFTTWDAATAVEPFQTVMTVERVAQLLLQIADARSVQVDEDVAAFVFQLTGGHAAAVRACVDVMGKALDWGRLGSGEDSQRQRRVTVAWWRDFLAFHFEHLAELRGPVAQMSEEVRTGRLSPAARELLERAVCAGGSVIQVQASELRTAEMLTADGWLVRSHAVLVGSHHHFRIASPLLRRVALLGLAVHWASSPDRSRKFVILPMRHNPHDMDYPAALVSALPGFPASIMRRSGSQADGDGGAAGLTTRSRSTLPGAAALGQLVPRASAYHAQLYAIWSTWFDFWGFGYARLDADDGEDHDVDTERCVSMLALRRTVDPTTYVDLTGWPPKRRRIVYVAASPSSEEVRAMYECAQRYIGSASQWRSSSDIGDQEAVSGSEQVADPGSCVRLGTCISFTAVATAADVKARAASALGRALVWPTEAQRASGVEAIHVVHDLGWTVAAVYSACKRGAGRISCTKVALPDQPLAAWLGRRPE